jgi:DNA polymerase-3 subunit delta'
MRLADVIGQPAVARLAVRLIARDRLPHAILLEGIPGCGRRTMATAIAQAVLCADRQAGDACGVCPACALVMQGTHPDLVSFGHDRDLATIAVDAVREQIVDAAYATPLVGDRRVFILHGLERWSLQAANALLKVLEEPPASASLVATTANAAAVLRTIRSRSQLYRLQPLAVPDVERILLAGGVPPSEAKRRAAAALGGHRGLWQAAPPIPLEALLHLAREGYRTEWVAEALDLLPTKVDAAAEEAGLTLAGEHRRLLRVWLAALAQALRPDLLAGGDLAERTAERIQRLALLQQDIARNLQARLVIEAIGLAETERLLRRTAS